MLISTMDDVPGDRVTRVLGEICADGTAVTIEPVT